MVFSTFANTLYQVNYIMKQVEIVFFGPIGKEFVGFAMMVSTGFQLVL